MRMQSTVACLTLLQLGCGTARVDVSTDRTGYVLGAGDSVAPVQLTVRNPNRRPLYLQTANGQADVLILIRVPTAGPEAWSPVQDFERTPLPKMGSVRLAPHSSHRSTYPLRRGDYRLAVLYGETPEKLNQHGVWVKPFSIR